MNTADVSSAGSSASLLTGPTLAALRVESREEVSADVVSLTLADPLGRRLTPWTPGSHIDLILPNGMSRQYSLCGNRWDTYRYRIAVLNEPDGRGGSRWIHENVREGDVLGYGGPRNHFPLVPADRYLFIAGGIGITPMIPMIDQAERTDRPWRLVYGGRSRQSMAFFDDLERLGDHVHFAPQDEVGLLDLDAILADEGPGTKVYCCGPAGLLEAVEAACRHLPPYTLHTERFTASAAESSQDRPFTLRLTRSGTDIDVPPGVSALDALAGAGIGILSSCRQGTCGTCEVTVVDGVPDHRDSVLSEVDRQAGDCMISCVSRAQTERLVLDL
ncbi:ferredoxin-NADP reductase [Rhodococcus sp. AG1013]|uniref:PDR/VanB family oxidoreductase n=1 Tax=Rhodococcus sp. AG1013 TaxID=2183996 RepID=UPI000E0A8976|nr:PDR/VanB family oxidoreductase [Rhodococcus sp. AG1013]RDI16948.1 ferredoxin-NADP reductase [Rhodococcus sp. AG1013]